MDQRRANAQRNDYQRQGGITMRKSVIAIIIIVLVVLYMSVFVVKEGERGITLRFGKVLRDDDNKPLVYEPGLHFKIPFIETVKMLDARIQTMDNQGRPLCDQREERPDRRLLHQMAHQRFQPLLPWQRAVATFRKRKCC